MDAFSFSTSVDSDAATIIVKLTIKIPAVAENITKTSNPVTNPLLILAVSSPITTGATHPAAAEP